jgi:hypothetical protein
MIKEFVIFKNTKPSENPKAPTHRIMAKLNGEDLVEIGAGWSKESKSGNKFLSCRLQNVWVDHTDRTKSRQGFAIANEKDIMTDEPENVPVSSKTDEIDEF